MSIILKDVHRTYKIGTKEVRAVNGVSLDIKRGGSIAIVGPSGAGKSTLLHLMGGLDHPTRGMVFLDDVNIYQLSDKERAKIRNEKVGFVFQFYHLLPEFTALENVMMPALIRLSSFVYRCSFNFRGKDVFNDKRYTINDIRRHAMDLLKLVGLTSRSDHRPGELSGGESQRVAIARSLMNEPQFLLCDEPTGNLDSKTSESVYDLLFDIRSKLNTNLIVVTHDEKAAQRFDRVIRIKDGVI